MAPLLVILSLFFPLVLAISYQQGISDQVLLLETIGFLSAFLLILIPENKQFKEENENLKAENKQFKAEIKNLEAEIKNLKAEIKNLKAEIKRLQDIINLKPPQPSKFELFKQSHPTPDWLLPPTWGKHHNNIQLSSDQLTAKLTVLADNRLAVIGSKPCFQTFKVDYISQGQGNVNGHVPELFIGVVPSNASGHEVNLHFKNGLFLYTRLGWLNVPTGTTCTWKQYTGPVQQGTTIQVTLNREQGKINFLLNGRDCGVAFSGVDFQLNWYPAALLCSKDESVQLLSID